MRTDAYGGQYVAAFEHAERLEDALAMSKVGKPVSVEAFDDAVLATDLV